MEPEGKLPEFSQEPKDGETFVGDSVTFTAVIDSDSTTTVDWLRGGEIIARDDRIDITANGNVHQLKILNANIDDELFYKCIARNKAGKAECEFELIVEGMPA